MSDLNKKKKSDLVQVGMFSFAGLFITKIINLASSIIIAPAIGPAGYGIFVLARDLCISFSLATKFGFDLGIIRFITERKNNPPAVRGLVQVSIIVVLVTSLILLALVWFGGADWAQKNIYKHKDFALVFSLLAFMVPVLSIMRILGASFRGLLEIKTMVMGEQIIQPLSRILLVLLFFIFSVSIWSVIWGTILSFLFSVIYFLYKAKRIIFVIKDVEWPTLNEFFRFLKYALTLSLTMSVALLLQKTDTLMLGYFKNLEDVGRYAIVQLSVPLIAIVNGAFSQRLAPEISRLVQAGDVDKLRSTMRSHVYWMTVSSAPLFFIFVFFGKDMLKIFGSDYAVGLGIIIILASAQFMQATLSSVGFVLSMTSKYSAELPLLLVALMINFGLNYLLIPQYGLLGAASATLIALSIGNILRIFVVYKIQKVWVIDYRLLFPLISAFVVMSSLTLIRNLFSDTSILGSFIAATLALILYMAFMYNFGLKDDERMIISNLFRNKA